MYRSLDSQLPRIRERKRRYPPCVLVEHQRARDRRFGALAAILALAEPAIDADRRAFGLLQIHAGGIDELAGVTDFAPQADGEAWLRQRMRCDRPAHHLRDREITRAVRQLDDLLEQSVWRIEGRMHVPQRAGAAE